jgi:coenzyme F420-reducing hydrogenase delta subunit
VGLEPERLEMFHIGASDAPKWAQAVQEMTRRAQELGPNRLRGASDVLTQAGAEARP